MAGDPCHTAVRVREEGRGPRKGFYTAFPEKAEKSNGEAEQKNAARKKEKVYHALASSANNGRSTPEKKEPS